MLMRAINSDVNVAIRQGKQMII